MKEKKIELLAPAGNKEGFYGAIHAGADAVYLGGDKFGARAYADNFTTEELIECIRYAHIWGRKVYLTVNTLVKEKEWDLLYDYILPFYDAGLDGVIIQDMGVFLYLKERFPDMEFHVSTQMTLTGSYGAGYMKELGACRIVPARELSLAEIKQIKADTGLEIEAFIHGAMCYCYSGQCLFSSILGGRSGNRGRCAQPCRLPYKVADGEECYPLSLKDMCTIENIPELIEAGIDSFKIEGRMKKPEYAAGVTSIYRKVIDRYYADPSTFQVFWEELKELSCLYIRSERQNGYYHKHNGADMVTINSPAYSGSDEMLLARIRKTYLEEKPVMPVEIYARFAVGEQASLTMVSGEHAVTVTGDVVQLAQNQPISRENVEKQLKKLGDTSFQMNGVWVELDEKAFYPLKAINELRRKAVSALEDSMIQSYGLSVKRMAPAICTEQDLAAEKSVQNESKDMSVSANSYYKLFTVNVRTLDQLLAVHDFIEKNIHESSMVFRRVYVEGDLLVGIHAIEVKKSLLQIAKHAEVYAVLPYIIRKRDGEYLKKLLHLISAPDNIFKGCMVRSLEGYSYLRDKEYQGKIAADAGFYIWNQQTLEFWRDKLDSFCLPLELNAGEQRSLVSDIAQERFAEKIIYGHLPMMITANCVVRTTSGCAKDPDASDIVSLTDRYKKRFPVVRNCEHCMNIIYNSIPLSLHGTMDKWWNLTWERLDFTVEDKNMTARVLEYFADLKKGKQVFLPFAEYTTGHEKRGVE